MSPKSHVLESPATSEGVSPEKRPEHDIHNDHLASRKLELEIQQLEHEVSPFNMWSKRIVALIAVATTFVALFSGIHQFSKATAESRLKRLNDEREHIERSFELLSSSNTKDIARGSLALIPYVDSPEHRENIYAGLKVRLSALQPPAIPEKMYNRTEQRRFEMSQIRAILPLIERFPPEHRNELFTIILKNESLKYGRLTGLEHLTASKEQWERALADDDQEFVEAVVISIAKHRPPFAAELLTAVLEKPANSSIVIPAAIALGELKATSAVDNLVLLLESPDNYVRASAAQALGTIGDKRAIEPLRVALAREKDDDTRASLRIALKRLGGGTIE